MFKKTMPSVEIRLSGWVVRGQEATGAPCVHSDAQGRSYLSNLRIRLFKG